MSLLCDLLQDGKRVGEESARAREATCVCVCVRERERERERESRYMTIIFSTKTLYYQLHTHRTCEYVFTCACVRVCVTRARVQGYVVQRVVCV